MNAENVDTRRKPLIDIDVLCILLRFVIQRMRYPQVISVINNYFFVDVITAVCRKS